METNREAMTLALLPDGALVLAAVSTEEVVHNHRLAVLEESHGVHEVSEWHVTRMDFETRWTECKWRDDYGGVTVAWGDREPGRRLLRHAKGVGLNLALKDVLEGRRPGSRAS